MFYHRARFGCRFRQINNKGFVYHHRRNHLLQSRLYSFPVPNVPTRSVFGYCDRSTVPGNSCRKCLTSNRFLPSDSSIRTESSFPTPWSLQTGLQFRLHQFLCYQWEFRSYSTVSPLVSSRRGPERKNVLTLVGSHLEVLQNVTTESDWTQNKKRLQCFYKRLYS